VDCARYDVVARCGAHVKTRLDFITIHTRLM
jgi:hypothetical protein